MSRRACHTLRGRRQLVTSIIYFPKYRVGRLAPHALSVSQIRSVVPRYKVRPGVLVRKPPHHRMPVLLHRADFGTLRRAILFTKRGRNARATHFNRVRRHNITLAPGKQRLCSSLLHGTKAKRSGLARRVRLRRAFHAFPSDRFLVHRRKLT